MTAIMALAFIALAVTSYYLVICTSYDDDLLERIALATVCVCAGVGFLQFIDGHLVLDPVSQGIIAGMAVLQTRYTVKVFKLQFEGAFDVDYEDGESGREADKGRGTVSTESIQAHAKRQVDTRVRLDQGS